VEESMIFSNRTDGFFAGVVTENTGKKSEERV
jgi:hypothetical protein